MIPASSRTMKEETLVDVPTSELDAIGQQFKAAGATVSTVLQDDGRWTVVATTETARP